MTNILIVEDEPIIAMDIRFTLNQIGTDKIYLVDNGKDAIKIVNSIPIDLIIMDINIDGEIDGIETADIIRKKHKIFIIYCSANSDGETLKRANLTAESSFIEKPFEQNQLIAIIKRKIPSLKKTAIQ